MLQLGMFVIANSAEKAVSGLDAQALPTTIRKAILLYPVTDVGGKQMAGYILCILITLVMPVLLTAVMCMRMKTVKPAIFGTLCFLVSQVFTRLPILQNILPKSAGYAIFQMKHPLCYMLMLALSAGVFEECGRWLFMRVGKIESAVNGVMFGFCHGGVEALLFVGIPALRLLFTPQDEWPDAVNFSLAATERVFAIVVHVGLSLLVLSGVERRKKQLLLLAILLHTLLDFGVVYGGSAGIGSWTIEIMAAAYSAGILLLSSYVYVIGKGHDYK